MNRRTFKKSALLSCAIALILSVTGCNLNGNGNREAEQERTNPTPQSTNESTPKPLNVANKNQTGSTQTAEMMQDFYAAFSKGDVEGASKFLTPDFIMHVPGRGKNAGEYWGVEGFQKFYKNILNYNGGKFSMQVPVLSINKDVVFTREAVQINRKHDPNNLFNLRFFMEYRIKNGKVSEAWTIPEDLYLYDAYWTPSSKAPNQARIKKPQGGAQGISDRVVNNASSKTNRDLVLNFYNTFWQGDLEGLKKYFAKDFIFYVPGKSNLAGSYKGFDGYLQFRDKLMKIAGGRYKLEIDSIAASKNDVFVREYIRMNRKWDPVPRVVPPVILHFEIRNGKITRVNDIPVNLYEYETFFTSPKR
ncbi:nuclear transport factor 2 family protein [Fictibacillus barbaricus]|uniref:Nuclear transport factor 2 family protein n=1 Tax=Fictibacillus barbaricus TaxID=182136 RepID=A0ABS2ZC13_9BACL|nr:nuclear transport factor 2 family protein [Fictibacillus barbaricus]MBN3544166.1 nuclear transport factor 2 family protein [Fictibacillus barbaricus]GGB69445.1 hypothetical protein GCM10007199_39590 [Fictibacillus barbaricus]